MSDTFKIYDPIDIVNEYNIFNKDVYNEDILVKGIPKLFISITKMNFDYDNIKRNNILSEMYGNYPFLLSTMSIYGANSLSCSSPFIRLFSNSFQSIDGKDVAARTIDISETFYGYKQTLPISIIDSKVGDSVSIKFREYKQLPITRMINTWVEYCEQVRRGTISPTQYMMDKDEIDYTAALYYFLLDFDGETILYYSKYTGAFPMSVPYASIVAEVGSHDVVDINVEFSYSFKEDNDLAILQDFNKISSMDSTLLKYNVSPVSRSMIPIEYPREMSIGSTGTEKLIGKRVRIVKCSTNYDSYLSSNTKYKLIYD